MPTDSAGRDTFTVMMCDGCGQGAPLGQSTPEVRSLATANGWDCDVGDLSEDFCPNCRKEPRHDG